MFVLELTKEEKDELEQFLLDNIYPDEYEHNIDGDILFDILTKVENSKPNQG